MNKLRFMEKEIIAKALYKNKGNVTLSAKELGIPRTTLSSKINNVKDLKNFLKRARIRKMTYGEWVGQ